MCLFPDFKHDRNLISIQISKRNLPLPDEKVEEVREDTDQVSLFVWKNS
jgi:hypothetical protein